MKTPLHPSRRAFTLLEVVFVIVILGIVASISSEVITQMFKSYVIQRAQYRANIKTELVLNQIANRLRYMIPGTVMARKDLNATAVPLQEVNSSFWKVMQWVGYDGDSFEAANSNRKPGWSGFCDLNSSTTTIISTPGSNLDLAKTIIQNLDGNPGKLRLYFAEDENLSYGVSNISGETITVNTLPADTMIKERYKLAWSSYALEAKEINNDHFDLLLHHHFPPVAGEDIKQDRVSLLLHNVTNFRFKYAGGVLRIKICKGEKVSATPDSDYTSMIHSCKEKVIF
jgi:prepilin-type N-terminal cleavage/methylation domain-containing protein